MAEFAYRVVNESGRYEAEVISLAQSSSDEASVLVRRPSTWRRGILVERRSWRGVPFIHVGAKWPEYEPSRYRARAALTALLSQYDLVQVVAGTPPWACPALDAKVPCLLWTASTLWADRASRIELEPPVKRHTLKWIARRAQVQERRALQQVQVVFALSPYTVEVIRKIAPEANMQLAMCGVDTRHYQPGPIRKRNYILSVARFSDYRKNVPMMLEAYRRLVDRVPSAPDLYLVGETPTQLGLRKLSELKLGDRVHVLPPALPHQLATLYREAQFFVLSSDEEGLGIVLLEAMSSGLPCVSTRCGGPEAVISHETGFLTPVRDAEPFARAMERLVSDSDLREQMGRAARQRVERHFSIQTASRPFLEEYDRILNREPVATAAYVR